VIVAEEPVPAAEALAIRAYTAADHDAVWALHNLALRAANAHGGNGPWDDDLHQIEAHYTANRGTFLVGLIAGEIVAMGALRPMALGGGAPFKAITAEIKRMRVHPARQRRGYGSAILRALEARARELGYTRLCLDTTTRQAAAQRFYERHGYQVYGHKTWSEFDLLLYAKDLAADAP
jgi:GNAT superfamily N-acetyltransferase